MGEKPGGGRPPPPAPPGGAGPDRGPDRPAAAPQPCQGVQVSEQGTSTVTSLPAKASSSSISTSHRRSAPAAGARRRARPPPPNPSPNRPATRAPQGARHEICEAGEAGWAAPAGGVAVQAGVAVTVIGGALLGVGEDRVGLV